jgi:hypothetical protein
MGRIWEYSVAAYFDIVLQYFLSKFVCLVKIEKKNRLSA